MTVSLDQAFSAATILVTVGFFAFWVKIIAEVEDNYP